MSISIGRTRKDRQQTKNEQGTVGLEFLGTMIFVFIMVIFAWQGFLAMHALSQANAAARDAARAESQTAGTGSSAGLSALSASLRPESSVTCGGPVGSRVTCSADVNVPILGVPWWGDTLSATTISRSATMPISSN